MSVSFCVIGIIIFAILVSGLFSDTWYFFSHLGRMSLVGSALLIESSRKTEAPIIVTAAPVHPAQAS
jgi:hypothetical protein